MVRPDLRLTLRTLLAFLDDTLDPAQARQIGKKLKRSTQALELIGRIRALLRSPQRPELRGAATDPNDLAEYLDNVLDPGCLAALENRLLDSPADLAEVAALHQVLSTLVAEPPGPAPEPLRQQLYALRNTVPTDAVRPRDLGFAPDGPPVPVAAQQMTFEPPLPGRPAPPLAMALPFAPPTFELDRQVTHWRVVAIGVAVFGIAVAIIVGLRPDGTEPPTTPAPQSVVATKRESSPRSEPVSSVAPKEVPLKGAPNGGASTPSPAAPPTAPAVSVSSTVEAKPSAARKPAETTPEPKPPAVSAKPAKTAVAPAPLAEDDPSVTVAVCASEAGLLLRRTPAGFARLPKGAVIKGRDELVNLEGFRSELETPGRLRVEIVNQAGLRVGADSAGKLVVDLSAGRLQARSAAEPMSLRLGWRSRWYTVELAPNAAIAVEAPSGADESPAILQVIRGPVALSSAGTTTALAGGYEVNWTDGDRAAPRPTVRPFAWLAESNGTDDNLRGFARLIPFGERVEPVLRQACEDERRPVRTSAVQALAAVADVYGLLDVVRRGAYSDVRPTAIAALRALRADPVSATLLRDRVAELYHSSTAEAALSLIAGFSGSSQPPRDIHQYLLELLESDERIIRELAIYNLKELTGHDFAYQADAPAYRRAASIQQFRRWMQAR